MRVVHICTSNSGGAAKAGIRLHHGLLQTGIQSTFLCLHQSGQGFEGLHRFSPKPHSFVKRQLRRLGFFRTQAERNRHAVSGKEGEYEILSFPCTDYDLASHPLVKGADIIHLHWVANFLDWPSFFKKANKPIVWTLHDMNPFQGGFHYHDDVVRNETKLGALEKRLREIKRKSLEGIQNLTVITPSSWLMEESSKSEILGRFPHYHISYGLDTEVFKPYSKELAREVFGLPKDKNILLFVSENTTNRRKGIDLLQDALKQAGNKNLLAVAIGRKPALPRENDPIHYLGSIEDERLMALAYAASDAFVIPSREDNLPNVMLEALACGRPVIGFPIGGIKEVVKHGANGLLAKDLSSEALAEVLIAFFDGKHAFDLEAIKEDAHRQFELSQQAGEYIELY
jgi:glycosyltransferase involved in cell wall biosynthesis